MDNFWNLSLFNSVSEMKGYFVHKQKHRQGDYELIMLPQKPLFGSENWYYWNLIGDQKNYNI